MGRPPGNTDYNKHLRAFEMYCSGVRKSDIASELGVTRPAVGSWAKKHHWDERVAAIVNRADEAVSNATGNKVAATLVRLQDAMASRVTELEALCMPSNTPAVRLQAIRLWLDLAGIKRAFPNPANPTTPKSLELIEDLLHEETKDSAKWPTDLTDTSNHLPSPSDSSSGDSQQPILCTPADLSCPGSSEDLQVLPRTSSD